MTTPKIFSTVLSQATQRRNRIPSSSHRVFWLIFTIVSLLFTINPAEARKIRTKHSIAKQSEKSITSNDSESSNLIISSNTDSLTFVEKIRPKIHFYGFDKTITSNLESFFVSNGIDSEISGMEIQITYFDLKGRQLHKRTVSIDCSIPAGETMRTDIKSWDTQKSFYYHKSAKPKRQATPFDVKIELLSITVNP
ncbi:MAG: hypothetical protein K2K25_11430 [Muribaculaceae bacterium]|nr:hypothetical protein [Muribaculaceae bacterium]